MAGCALLTVLALPRASAQYAPQRLDSVVRRLDPAAQDTAQLQLLILAADSWFTSPNAYPYLARLDALSRALLGSQQPSIARSASHAQGYFRYFTGYHAKFERNIPLALRSFRDALALFTTTGDAKAAAGTHDALGILFRATGDPVQAIASFKTEAALARALGDAHLRDQAWVHLAGASADRGLLSLAHTYLDSCAATANADRSAALNERARILDLEGRTAEAFTTLERSLQLAAGTGNEWDELPVLAPLARLQLRSHEPGKSLALGQQCAELAARMGDHVAECGCLVITARARKALGENTQAERDLLRALDLAKAVGNVGSAREMGDEGSMLSATEQLKDLYADQGDEHRALAMTQLWASLKDSVQRMNGRDEIMTFEFQKEMLIDSVEHARHIEQQQRAAEQAMAREHRKRDVVGLIGLAAVLAAVAIWSRLRLLRRTNAAILSAQEKLLASEKQREAQGVRVRIARDMHDELGGQLTKLALLGSEAKHQSRVQADITGTMDRIAALSREATSALHDVVWSVDPERDSVSALQQHALAYTEKLLDGTGLRGDLHFHHEGPDRSIGAEIKRDLFLFLKEALNNALKHARASRIDVSMETGPSHYRVIVKDDGVGFGDQKSMGNGLRNMRMRAQRIGAVLHQRSDPGQGTSVSLEGTLPGA